MKKIITAMLGLFMITTITTPSFAAEDKYPTIDDRKTGEITIDYKEDIDGKDPVVGAEFTYYKVALIGSSGEYISIIDGIDAFDRTTNAQEILDTVKEVYEKHPDENSRAIYQAVTDKNGISVTSGMEQGLYLAEESTPAVEHFASIPFLFSLPYTSKNVWEYQLTAEPKSLPGGDLIIKKTLSGNDVETDREFHFKVTLDYDGEIHYVKTSGEFGYIKSGDTIALKGGQSVTLDTIPAGCAYQVEEIEANKNGYVTESEGTEGNIVRTEPRTASFTNTRNKTSSTKDVNTNDPNTIYVAGGICLMSIMMFLLLESKRRSAKK